MTGNRSEIPVNGRKSKMMLITVNQFRFQIKWGPFCRSVGAEAHDRCSGEAME
jgi:hypothetical protein